MNHGFRTNNAASRVAAGRDGQALMQRAWRAFGLTLLALALMAGYSTRSRAADDPTIHQVYQAAESGRMPEAQAMMDKVLRDHPNSAKAHYVQAELLAKQGRMDTARSELATAERIEPGLSFASPQAVRELRARITGSAAQPGYAVLTPAASPGPSMPWGTIIIALLAVGVVVFVVRAMARRNAVATGAPTYANNGFGRGAAGYPAGPGYGPQGGPYPYGAPAPTGGGIGSGIMGGLATGAALGAGMVAGEALAHHFTDRDHGTSLAPDNTAPGRQASDNWAGQNDDMGGNDFGLSDSSSWDSGGGDGGGGSDW